MVQGWKQIQPRVPCSNLSIFCMVGIALCGWNLTLVVVLGVFDTRITDRVLLCRKSQGVPGSPPDSTTTGSLVHAYV